jgi:hypothetical protein
MEENINMKCCSKCKNIKSINEFFKNRCFDDGYANQCKNCKNSKPNIFHSKLKCECGKTIQNFYLKYHLQTNVHLKYIKEIESLNNKDLIEFS